MYTFFLFHGNPLKKLLLIWFLCAFSNVCAVEISLFFNGFGPSKSDITTDDHDVKSGKEWDSEHQFTAGTEVNFTAEFSPIRYGFGVGYKSPLKEDDTKIIPASIPVWGDFYFGRINTDNIFSPYIVARIGALPLLTCTGSWWERPFDFFVAGGLGVVLPFRIGLEVNYDYASVLKSFEYRDTKFRISTGKLGARLSVGFEISRDKVYNPHNRIELNYYEATAQTELYGDEEDDEDYFSKRAAQPAKVPQNAEIYVTPAKSAAPAETAEPAPIEAAPVTTEEPLVEEPQIEEPVEQKAKTTSEKRRDNLRKKAAKSKSAKGKTTTKAKAKTKGETKSKTKAKTKKSAKKRSK